MVAVLVDLLLLFGIPIVVPIVVFLVIYYIAREADEVVAQATKERFSATLRRQRIVPWTEAFVRWFDLTFIGKNYISSARLSFIRSSFSSFFWYTIVLLTLMGSSSSYRTLVGSIPMSTFVGIQILLFLLNLVPDYVSLVETRQILRWMERSTEATRVVLLGVLDIALTGLICVVFYVPIVAVIHKILVGYPLGEVVFRMSEVVSLRGVFVPLSTSIYTTFVTSIWTLFYNLAQILVKVIPFFQMTLRIDDRPFRSVGIVLALIAAILALIVVILVRIVGE